MFRSIYRLFKTSSLFGRSTLFSQQLNKPFIYKTSKAIAVPWFIFDTIHKNSEPMTSLDAHWTVSRDPKVGGFENLYVKKLLWLNTDLNKQEVEGLVLISRAFLWDTEMYPYMFDNDFEARLFFKSWCTQFIETNAWQYENHLNAEQVDLVSRGLSAFQIPFDPVNPYDSLREFGNEVIKKRLQAISL